MEKSKRNLILFMPSIDGGGVEKNLFIISNYLSKFYQNLTLITFDKRFKKKFNNKINILTPGSNSIKSSNKYYKYYKCLILLVKVLLKNKDTITFAFQANIYSIILCKLLFKKIIVRSNSSPSGWNNNFFKKLIFKIFLPRADAIIVNSVKFKNELDKKFNVKSILIYNPLNLKEIVEYSKLPLKDNFFNSKKFINIINISRFTDQKDHITLLKAFEIVSKKINCKLMIMGYGKNLGKIKRFINEKKLNKKIKIVNFKSNPFNYLKKADIFVLTSIYEGLPNVLLEALALKKYIISTDCPTGPAEIINKNKFGDLVKIGDYKTLSKKIIEFKRNSKSIKIKKQNGFESLVKFDYKKNLNKYLNTIQSI